MITPEITSQVPLRTYIYRNYEHGDKELEKERLHTPTPLCPARFYIFTIINIFHCICLQGSMDILKSICFIITNVNGALPKLHITTRPSAIIYSASVLATTMEILDSTDNFPSSMIKRPFPTHELSASLLYLGLAA